ncbi:lipoprotein [Microtetraspora sp. NBRC 13810]|uniref:SGNH/GDSL hydrolase family protein n=1 Tax=Microtetraspora sp. NBRC 13810 TaxID=3030990 RepID=UPI0024A2ACE8|nr:SGNH/GDSL hydrolase family protein [Microtetraspora sp. NBRC 13810]GLW06527.1 lipoprotein [Microtetraspora sp. NBRC 13810]
MVRTSVAAFAGAAIVSATCLVPGQAAASTWRPEDMAALGDSISAGFNVCGWFVSCTSRSWSAGDHIDVDSHYLRIRRADAPIDGRNLNLARPGAVSADLAGQARQAVQRGADYVTILIGANDVCAREEGLMTSLSAYRRNIEEALGVLRQGLPETRVFIASVPDVKRLWAAGKDNALARGFWRIGRLCQSLLAQPTSMAEADRARRDRVRKRVIGYNSVLAQACAAYGPACRYDGGAVFSYPFTMDHISKWDYFHPNVQGQRAIADRTFARVADWFTPDPAEEPVPLL